VLAIIWRTFAGLTEPPPALHDEGALSDGACVPAARSKRPIRARRSAEGPVGRTGGHRRRRSDAEGSWTFEDRAIAERGCWFIRCSPRTFPLEAAAVRLGQLEGEEWV